MNYDISRLELKNDSDTNTMPPRRGHPVNLTQNVNSKQKRKIVVQNSLFLYQFFRLYLTLIFLMFCVYSYNLISPNLGLKQWFLNNSVYCFYLVNPVCSGLTALSVILNAMKNVIHSKCAKLFTIVIYHKTHLTFYLLQPAVERITEV